MSILRRLHKSDVCVRAVFALDFTLIWYLLLIMSLKLFLLYSSPPGGRDYIILARRTSIRNKLLNRSRLSSSFQKMTELMDEVPQVKLPFATLDISQKEWQRMLDETMEEIDRNLKRRANFKRALEDFKASPCYKTVVMFAGLDRPHTPTIGNPYEMKEAEDRVDVWKRDIEHLRGRLLAKLEDVRRSDIEKFRASQTYADYERALRNQEVDYIRTPDDSDQTYAVSQWIILTFGCSLTKQPNFKRKWSNFKKNGQIPSQNGK